MNCPHAANVIVLRTGDAAIGVRCKHCRANTPFAPDGPASHPTAWHGAKLRHRCVWCRQPGLYDVEAVVRFIIELPHIS